MLKSVADSMSLIMVYRFAREYVVTRYKSGKCADETIQESESDVEGNGGLSREALGNS